MTRYYWMVQGESESGPFDETDRDVMGEPGSSDDWSWRELTSSELVEFDCEDHSLGVVRPAEES